MVTGSLLDDDGGGGESRPLPDLRYGAKFEEMCGYYMSLGMSYHDYWDEDNCMTKYYKAADTYNRERRNTELWLQAYYFYEALLDVSPVFNPLTKRNKPFIFRSEPIPITAAGSREAKERENKKRLENGKAIMQAMMLACNDNLKRKEGK